MQSVKLKTYGLMTSLSGALILFAAYMAGIRIEALNAVAFGIIGLGILLFIFGMFSSLVYQVKPEKSVHHDDTAIAASAIIRCMLAICTADGHVADKEVSTIAKIYKKLTGSDIDEETIRETATDMLQQGSDLADELGNVKKLLDAGLKGKIIRASLYILAADGKIEAEEEATLEVIREGLGVPKGAFNDTKKKFLEEAQ